MKELFIKKNHNCRYIFIYLFYDADHFIFNLKLNKQHLKLEFIVFFIAFSRHSVKYVPVKTRNKNISHIMMRKIIDEFK